MSGDSLSDPDSNSITDPEADELTETGDVVQDGETELPPSDAADDPTESDNSTQSDGETTEVEKQSATTVGEGAPWVGDVTVPLTFSLGKVEVTLKQLRSMQSGYTFETLAALEAPVTIRAYDQEIGRGEIIQVEDRIGVRLVEMNYDERH